MTRNALIKPAQSLKATAQSLFLTALVVGAITTASSAAEHEATKISGTRLWITLPQSCVQNQSDNWIQCRDPNGNPMAQFNFFVGVSADEADDKRYTQENLGKIAEKKLFVRDLAEFSERKNEWIDLLVGPRKMTRAPETDFAKTKNGIWAVYAVWTYLNDHNVELISYFYEIWDRGQAINIAVVYPIVGETENFENTDLVGRGLASLEFR